MDCFLFPFHLFSLLLKKNEKKTRGRVGRKEIWYSCSKIQLILMVLHLLDKSRRFRNLQIHVA